MRNIRSSSVVLGLLALSFTMPGVAVEQAATSSMGESGGVASVANLSTEDQAAVAQAKGVSRAFRAISKLAGPSVVSIEVTQQAIATRRQGRLFPQVPNAGPGGRPGNGLGAPMGVGTGFIVAEEGYVVTMRRLGFCCNKYQTILSRLLLW
jgi:hypothetical protein